MRVMLFSLLVGISTSTLAETWRVVGSEQFAPYSYTTATDSEPQGLDVDLVRAVLDEAGVEYHLRLYPWQRAKKMLETGEAEMAFVFAGTAERQRQYQLVGPIREGSTRFMSRRDFALEDWQSFTDLAPYVIGQVLGYAYETAFDNAALKRDETAQQPGQLVSMLLAKRIELIVGDSLQLQYLARQQHGSEQVRMLPTPLVKMPRYVAFGKNDLLRAKQFNAALEKLRDTGELDAIVERWRQQIRLPQPNSIEVEPEPDLEHQS